MADQAKAEDGAAQKLAADRKKISLLLETGNFSDVTIIVGPQKKTFKLHRNIICLHSRFFERACLGGFEESTSREIQLPEIEPVGFEIVVLWLYEDRDSFTSKLDNDAAFLASYATADFLDIPVLKRDILELVRTIFIKDLLNDAGEPKIKDPSGSTVKMFKNANISEWDDLRRCVAALAACYQFSMKDIARSGEDGAVLFLAVLAAVLVENMDNLFCGDCERDLEGELRAQDDICVHCRSKPVLSSSKT
ncbi:hypothetical protein ABW19_dt0204684 [Dactylella cylindrospora]|nr:hypothetical protein ABW19_dt0204684 [Dactylella cylindrospora]